MSLKKYYESGFFFATIRHLFVLVASVCFFAGCSIPNLEGGNCAAARDSVSRFYWLRFGNLANEINDFTEKRDAFLSTRLIEELNNSEENPNYFSPVVDPPKTFRLGVCREITTSEVSFQLLFFWKTDSRSEQREGTIKAVKENEKWRIDSVSIK